MQHLVRLTRPASGGHQDACCCGDESVWCILHDHTPFDNMPSPRSVESAKIRGSCIALFPHQSLSSACSGISMHVKTGRQTDFQLDVLFRMGLAQELGLLLSWELVREESHSQEFSSSDFSFAFSVPSAISQCTSVLQVRHSCAALRMRHGCTTKDRYVSFRKASALLKSLQCPASLSLLCEESCACHTGGKTSACFGSHESLCQAGMKSCGSSQAGRCKSVGAPGRA